MSVQGGIALIGMAGRFPQAASVREYWKNLLEGRECLTEFSDVELLSSGVPAAMFNQKGFVRSGGVLSDIDLFDAGFFNFTRREAECADPQQRLFIEAAWEALENAGYDPSACPGPVGLFGGSSLNNYYFLVHSSPELLAQAGRFQLDIGSDPCFLCTRTSYKLNLRGPSVNVSTACSTSLVAAVMACQSLLTNQCDVALAGGVSIQIPQAHGYLHEQGGIMSPDGHCRTFDERAQGTVSGNGVGMVVMKRLEDALAAGDNIIAVIRGYAINNDGAQRVGFTAPSIQGQSEVICEALSMAGVSAETVSYVEAHGTGTRLGDPIEIEALTLAHRHFTQKQQYCAIGSVKTNIGHLDTASGVAGLIKTALSLQHGVIPASLHYQKPNPRIDFAPSPFFVNDRLREWRCEGPRRAGVSSFGIGGTNAHIVLEEAPRRPASSASRALQVLPLSARTPTALQQVALRLADHLEQDRTNLADTAYTLALGRKAFQQRMAVVCGSQSEAVERLRSAPASRGVVRGQFKGEHRSVALLLGGQGSQYVGMGRELYEQEKVFRKAVDESSEYLKPLLGVDLQQIMHSGPDALLRQTWLTQPALYVLEWALLKQWESWGVRAEAMIGHSLGELVAATRAEVLGEEEALKLVALRGWLMWQTEPGAMLSVLLSEGQAETYIRQGVSIAAVNSHDQVVYSGPESAIAELHRELEEKGLVAKRLEVERAFHSAALDAIRAEFLAEVGKLKLRVPRRRFISNVTGKWAGKEVTHADYWWRQMREPVLFAAGIREMSREQIWLWLEVGAGATLGKMVRAELSTAVITASLRGARESASDSQQMAQALGTLWAQGINVDWAGYYDQERRHRVPLPTYPFERQRYWAAGGQPQPPGESVTDEAASSRPEPPIPTPIKRNIDLSISIEVRIAEVWKDILGVTELGVADSFFDLGGTSLLVIHMAQQLRSRLDIAVPLESFLAEPTIAQLVRAITGDSRPRRGNVLAPLRAAGTRTPLFGLHPIGGGCFIYRDLVERLGPDQPFYGLQAPDIAELGEAGDPYSSLEEMAASYIDAIYTVQPTGPHLLVGLSWGGVLAFEMAQQLRRADQDVALVALLDTPSPEQLARLDMLDDAAIMVGLARDLGFQRGIELHLAVAELQGLTEQQRASHVLRTLQAARILPANMPADWIVRQLRGYRSRLRLVRNYTPRIYHGRLTFLGAAALDAEMRPQLDAAGFDYMNLAAGWAHLSSQPVEVHTVPGNHSEIVYEPNVKVLATRLIMCIDRCMRSKDRHEDHPAPVQTV